MPTKQQLLIAGLEAQGWLETATISASWRRFGKFGRGAMYVVSQQGWHNAEGGAITYGPDELHWSQLYKVWPEYKVQGPILEQVLAAGDKWLAQETPDTTALLIELLDKEQP